MSNAMGESVEHAERVVEQIAEYERLKRKTLLFQEAGKPSPGGPLSGACDEERPNIFGTVTVKALFGDIDIDIEMKFNTGEKYSCAGKLTGFGFCASASVFNAYWNENVSPQWILNKTGFVQLAVVSGTGEITLWLDNVLLSVIGAIGLGAGYAGAAGPIVFHPV